VTKVTNENHLSPTPRKIFHADFFDPDPAAVIDSRDFRRLENEQLKIPPISVAHCIDGRNRKTFSQYSQAGL